MEKLLFWLTGLLVQVGQGEIQQLIKISFVEGTNIKKKCLFKKNVHKRASTAIFKKVYKSMQTITW